MDGICIIIDLLVYQFVDPKRVIAKCFFLISLECAKVASSLLFLHKLGGVQNILHNFNFCQLAKKVLMVCIKIIMLMDCIFAIKNMLKK